MMRKLTITTVGLLSAVLAIAVLAAPASAKPGIKSLAKAECKQERATDTREFVNHYGGKGKAALKRCIRHEKREATRDCKQDRRFETNEFIAEYGGTDRRALKRCIRDELR
jgi:hypothetical protein